MDINWNNISQQEFLEEYWQKKPVILKQAILQFEDVISPEEIAGLAMEDFIDSRIITNKDNDWNVKHGPFESFDHLPETNWSLLVQGVDNWFDSVAELKQLVAFLPKWRIDDVMLSYSTNNAGVGAHLDQYDVFIVQGQGKRRWKAGAVDQKLKQTEISKDLLQLESFEPIVDQILEAGDIIYIPPFSPHQGTTIEPCINYSIGFRAPSAKELLSEFADYVIDNDIGNKRYQGTGSPFENKESKSSLVAKSEVTSLKSMLIETIEQSDEFDRFLNLHLTKATRELDIAEDQDFSWQQLENELSLPNSQLIKTTGLRTSTLKTESNILFYCHGLEFICSIQQYEFVKYLENEALLTLNILKSFNNWLENVQLVTTLVNHGFWHIDERDDIQDIES